MAILHCYLQLGGLGMSISPLLLTSSCQEWQFHIATDILVVRNGKLTWLLTPTCSRMAFSHSYLTSSGQEWLI